MTETEARLLAENAALRKQIADMTAQFAAALAELSSRIEHLVAQRDRDSSNSSKPSSTDPPWKNVKRRPPSEPSGKKRGGQPGHKGHERKMLPATDSWDVHADRCEGCGAALDPTSVVPDTAWIHQLVELVAATEVRNYHMQLHQCGCGKRTRAKLPPGVPPTAAGPRLQAAITTFIAKFGLSRKDMQEALDDVFGVKLSVGAIQGVTDRIAQATRPAVQDIGQQLQAAKSKHCDETGWRHGGERAWVWVVTNAMGAFFKIDPKRSREALMRLLPELQGVIHTDRWRVYDVIEAELRQLCHAHLRRDIQALIDLGPPTRELGTALLKASNALFHEWHRFVRSDIDRAGLQAAMVPVQSTWRELIEQGAAHAHKKARALGRDLKKQWVSLWTFLAHEDADPTNNHAEQTIRPCVLLRKTNGGTASDLGAEFVANLQSILVTAKRQGVRIMDWLQRAFQAWWQPMPLPKLLPRPTG